MSPEIDLPAETTAYTRHPYASFYRLCLTLAAVAATRSGKQKTLRYAAFLRALSSVDEVELAVRFTGEGPFSGVSGRRVGTGHRTVAETAALFCGVDYERVFRPCRTAAGSASEVIEKLMEYQPQAQARRRAAWLSLRETARLYETLSGARSREQKQTLLAQAWEQMTPLEIRYMIRIMMPGSLRIGFDQRRIIPAIALAFTASESQVARVHMLTGSIGETARLARLRKLDTAQFKLFQPVTFMLASPWNPGDEGIHIPDYLAEEKFDGMRVQVHLQADPPRVALYSRDLNEVTDSFPDVAESLLNRLVHPPDPLPSRLVLDGEVCVMRGAVIEPFQKLQKRMGVKKPGNKLLETHPAGFIAYDLLYRNGHLVLDEALEERRTQLLALCRQAAWPVSRQFVVTDSEEVQRAFERARAHGNEGLMLKRRGSRYEYGQRNKSWLKVKEPGGSLDTVIMYAHAGSGRRGGLYSDFTLGIRVDEDPRYNEQFVPIGKAYGGYSDEELKWLNRRIKELAVERFGPTLSLMPGIVVELEFDAIQRNARTKAGYSLRLPRFRAIRRDLSPADTDTLAEVERLYEERMRRPAIPAGDNKPVLYL